MNAFKRGDQVRIVWPDVASHGLTATIVGPKTRAGVDGYTIDLARPPEGQLRRRWIPAHRIELAGGKDQIPADDILAIVAAHDGTSVAAIHDRTENSVDIDCSVHGPFYTYCYARVATVTEIDQARAAAVSTANRHANHVHTARVDSAEGQQP